MADNRKLAFISSLAFAASVFAATTVAGATCPKNESFFGTIQRVNGNTLTVRTPTNHWADVQINPGARIDTNGNSMRPGTYVGLYGCVAPNGVFRAQEVTLASSPSGYNEHVSGVIKRIENGKIIVAETNGRYGEWYVPDTNEYHVGQQVAGVGMLAGNGAFYPQAINGHSVAYDTDVSAPASSAPSSAHTITLSGTIQRVGGNTLLVYEPASKHSATWVVADAGKRFRVGERVSATGTEDRFGRFYVQQITTM